MKSFATIALLAALASGIRLRDAGEAGAMMKESHDGAEKMWDDAMKEMNDVMKDMGGDKGGDMGGDKGGDKGGVKGGGSRVWSKGGVRGRSLKGAVKVCVCGGRAGLRVG